LFSLAMKDIEIQVQVKEDLITEKLNAYSDHKRDLDEVLSLIKLKIKGQS
jgi:hypothetical protein